MNLDKKIEDIEKEVQDLNVRLQQNEQERQALTQEIIKKYGGLEALRDLKEADKTEQDLDVKEKTAELVN